MERLYRYRDYGRDFGAYASHFEEEDAKPSQHIVWNSDDEEVDVTTSAHGSGKELEQKRAKTHRAKRWNDESGTGGEENDHDHDDDDYERGTGTKLPHRRKQQSDKKEQYTLEERRRHWEQQQLQQKQAQVGVLPAWLENPIRVNAFIDKQNVRPMRSLAIHPLLLSRLEAVGFENVFPLQLHVVPHILVQTKSVYHGGDVCVSAPTGSGKTLTYVIPILNALCTRTVPRLRAVVVMPTRQLAQQVYDVFTKCSRGICSASVAQLSIAMAAGQSSFAKEQLLLQPCTDGSSRVDVLIVTPGRLVDHINQTRGFSLEHLRFFVADEADRLLMQSYHGWLSTLYKALYNTLPSSKGSDPTRPCARSHNQSHGAVMKMFFSATLTREPAVIANLRLAFPRMYLATQSASQADDTSVVISPQLKEYFVPCETHDKPLALLHLLFSFQLDRTLVFVSSLQATSRLFKLLQYYGGLRVDIVSSSTTAHKNSEALRKFARGEVTVLVCSDTMARGMDLPNVENVISYDCPNNGQTYVHRVGRAARAGAQGTAYTIVQPNEQKEFLQKRRKIDGQTVERLDLVDEELAEYQDRFTVALQQLKSSEKTELSNGHKQRGKRNKKRR